MNLDDSVIAYKALRNIYMDGKGNTVQLNVQHDMKEDEVEQVVLKAVEEGLLNLVKDSEPREYTVDIEKVAGRWKELWSNELDEIPVTPKNFESFLVSYVKSYLRDEKHSTIREMLVEEFHLGLNNQSSKSYLSSDFRQLNEKLNSGFEGKRSPGEHIKYGLDHR